MYFFKKLKKWDNKKSPKFPLHLHPTKITSKSFLSCYNTYIRGRITWILYGDFLALYLRSHFEKCAVFQTIRSQILICSRPSHPNSLNMLLWILYEDQHRISYLLSAKSRQFILFFRKKLWLNRFFTVDALKYYFEFFRNF